MKKKKTQETLKNAFWLRVYDVETIKSIHELFDTKQFDSMNDLLNRAVRVGIEKLYLDFGKRRKLQAKTEGGEAGPKLDVRFESVDRRLKEMSLSIDDVLVLMSMLEMLTSTLYNVELARIKGERLTPDLIDSGYFSTLPPAMQEIKDKLIARMNTKKRN